MFLFTSGDPASHENSMTSSPSNQATNSLSAKTYLIHSQFRATTITAIAAKMLLSRHPQPLCSLQFPSQFETRGFACHQVQPWPGLEQNARRPKKLIAHVSLHEAVSSSSALADYIAYQQQQNPCSLVLLADSVGYSLASYYTSLGLFVISVPGLWSLIKRSVKSKIVQKTYIGEGEKKAPNQVAGEILSFFARNNFAVTGRGETITFEGMMVPSRGQAALLTFCTCISLASVALVLTITFPDFGNNWFWITILSPLAGAYYWTRASRKEQIKVKMIVADDGTLSEIIVQGDDQQVEQMRKELQLSEKGMIYVRGVFDR